MTSISKIPTPLLLVLTFAFLFPNIGSAQQKLLTYDDHEFGYQFGLSFRYPPEWGSPNLPELRCEIDCKIIFTLNVESGSVLFRQVQFEVNIDILKAFKSCNCSSLKDFVEWDSAREDNKIRAVGGNADKFTFSTTDERFAKYLVQFQNMLNSVVMKPISVHFQPIPKPVVVRSVSTYDNPYLAVKFQYPSNWTLGDFNNDKDAACIKYSCYVQCDPSEVAGVV